MRSPSAWLRQRARHSRRGQDLKRMRSAGGRGRDSSRRCGGCGSDLSSTLFHGQRGEGAQSEERASPPGSLGLGPWSSLLRAGAQRRHVERGRPPRPRMGLRSTDADGERLQVQAQASAELAWGTKRGEREARRAFRARWSATSRPAPRRHTHKSWSSREGDPGRRLGHWGYPRGAGDGASGV